MNPLQSRAMATSFLYVEPVPIGRLFDHYVRHASVVDFSTHLVIEHTVERGTGMVIPIEWNCLFMSIYI